MSEHLEAKASTHGIAASLVRSGNASVSRYGIAYAKEGGRANGGASGVAFTRKNGYSIAGDGGVAVAHHRGDAQAGFFGIAYSQNPGPDNLGRVRGHMDCLLVIGWVANNATYSKEVRVDGVNFEDMVWYTLDPTNNYEWVKAADQSTPKGA